MSEPRADEGCVVGPRLSPAAGVAISGIDLSRPLSPASRQRIFDAFLATHVVVFPGQTLSREAQFAFTANFGEVEGPEACRAHAKRRRIAHVISNLDGAGNPVDRSSSAVSNYRWHTDKSYYRTPPSMTTLYGVALPSDGGDTEFANTALGYAALPEATKRRIAPLRVVFRWGAVLGQPPAPDPAHPQPVDHPLVRIHPETGVPALYLGNHASHILGLRAVEGASPARSIARAHDPAGIRLHPPLAQGRSGDVGQSLPLAPCGRQLRGRQRAARPAPHRRPRHRAVLSAKGRIRPGD